MNSRDYDEKVIDYMCDLFSPAYLREIARERVILVAEVNGRVLGVVSLNGDEISTLYVSPGAHGQRIGRAVITRDRGRGSVPSPPCRASFRQPYRRPLLRENGVCFARTGRVRVLRTGLDNDEESIGVYKVHKVVTAAKLP